MEFAQPVDDPCIGLSNSLGLPDIVKPCGRVIMLRPELWLGEISQQAPVACSVAASDPTALCHENQELPHVVLNNPVLNREHNGAAAMLDL
jgi:hypothetical protein